MSPKFFNPHESVEVSHGNLPHWEQTDATYFITFRTIDSIPVEQMDQWTRDREKWLATNGIDNFSGDWQWQLECLDDTKRQEYHQLFTAKWHANLDEGHGACVLRNPQLAKIVGDALLYFDGDRYEMSDFVVMPNHVHLLAGISGRGKMKQLCRSWKKFSATEINKHLGVSGSFWQPESFDHIVRGPGSYQKFRQYIADNPAKAGLREGEYLLWQCSSLE